MNGFLQVSGNGLNIDVKEHHVDIVAKLFAGNAADVLNHLLVNLGYIRVTTIDIQVNLSPGVLTDFLPFVTEDCSSYLVINTSLNLNVVHCYSNNLFDFLGQMILYLICKLDDILI